MKSKPEPRLRDVQSLSRVRIVSHDHMTKSKLLGRVSDRVEIERSPLFRCHGMRR